MKKAVTLTALLAALLAPGAGARANGRFPASQYVVVGPGARDEAIVVRSTVGLFVSRDRGRSFAWLCEDGLGYGGTWDPPVALAHDGRVTLGLTDGLLASADDCAFARPTGSGLHAIIDLAHDRAGMRVVAVEGEAGGRSQLFLSLDGGRSFEAPPGALIDGAFTTVDFAPSDANVLYAIARSSATGLPVLYRSMDGGRTLSTVAADFLGARDAYLSAVDPTDARGLWVRAVQGTETWLLRSRDGGARWERVHTLPEPMLGFALSTDGARVWIGGEASGLLTSTDGRRFTRVLDSPVRCLRHHAGALYLCTDYTRGGNALARWPDGAREPEPLLFFRDVEASPDCPVQSPIFQRCAPAWRAQRERLLSAVRDAGNVMDAGTTTDAGQDVTLASMDAIADVATDAGFDGAMKVRRDPPRDGCGCRAGRASAGPWPWLLALCAARIRRRGLRRAPTCC